MTNPLLVANAKVTKTDAHMLILIVFSLPQAQQRVFSLGIRSMRANPVDTDRDSSCSRRIAAIIAKLPDLLRP
jgi:hypothetical protein